MKKIFTLVLLLFLVTTGAKARKVEATDIDQLNTAVTTDYQLNDTIMLTGVNMYELTAPLNVSGKTLTFIGLGTDETMLNGNDLYQIFYADANLPANITIESLAMFSGNSTTNGGAICIKNGSVTLKNCIIKNCNAKNEGGAIAVLGASSSSATLINCMLIDNNAEKGGAITAVGDLTLINTTIAKNEATTADGGGGLYIAGTNPTVRILNSILVKNETITDAGRYIENNIAFENAGYSLEMLYCAYGGGAAFTNTTNTNLAVSNPRDVLAGNDLPAGKAQTAGTPTLLYGSDFWYLDKTADNWKSLTATGTKTLSQLGGANADILSDNMMGYSYIDLHFVTTHEDVEDATDGKTSLREAIIIMAQSPLDLPITFSSAIDGKAIVLDETEGTLIIPKYTTITIRGNGADKTIIDGGWNGTNYSGNRIFFTADRSSLTIEGVTLQRGEGTDSNGGAIQNNSKLSLTNCVLKENKSTGTGAGAIYNEMECNAILKNCQLIDNSSDSHGGAIQSLSPLVLINCALTGNTASGNGGAIYIQESSLLMINSTLTANSASANGGGLNVDAGSTTTVLNSIIVENTVAGGGEGGDIYNGGDATSIRLAYSAYGDWAGTETSEAYRNLSGLSASAVFADPGNSLELLEGSDVATKGTLVGMQNGDNTVGFFMHNNRWSYFLPSGSGAGDVIPITTALDTDPASGLPVRTNSSGVYSMGAVLPDTDPEPSVHHELIFIVDEGIRINPDKTGYHIEEGHDYTFYMYMNAGNENKKPYVTVNGQPVSIRETQDGTGWVYRIPAVYEDKTIEIVLQDLTDNLNPEEAGVVIYSSAGALIVDVAQSTSVTIYNITGQAVAQERVDSRMAFNLPKGIYIIKTDKGVTKAVVR